MEVKTICITVVSSRNLTTLFSSICMFHPEIQILNHFPSINKSDSTNFLVEYSDAKIADFISKVDEINRKSLKISGEGGVITKAHAFNSNTEMKNEFFKRFKNEQKVNYKSIIWKDSFRNHTLVRKNFAELIDKTDMLRFLLIVRNPMDCATSCSSPGYNAMFEKPDKESILNELFERYKWFFECEKRYPKFFMSFFEFEALDKADDLQEFLQVNQSSQWKKDFEKFWIMQKTYNHTVKFKNQYKLLINSIDDDSLKVKFKRFLNG